MAKRLCISVKNDEYSVIESIAKEEGLKPIDIINRRIFDSKKGDTMDSRLREIEEKILEQKNVNDVRFSELKESLYEIKNQIDSLKNSLSLSLRTISFQTSFASNYSTQSLKLNVPQGKTFDDSLNELATKSKETAEKIYNNFS